MYYGLTMVFVGGTICRSRELYIPWQVSKILCFLVLSICLFLYLLISPMFFAMVLNQFESSVSKLIKVTQREMITMYIHPSVVVFTFHNLFRRTTSKIFYYEQKILLGFPFTRVLV